MQEREIEPKTLDNTDTAEAAKKVSDLAIYGDGDKWRLLCKASSVAQGWMKSTKVMEVQGQRLEGSGCLVQVTTQQRNPDGSYAVAEAVCFVPGATHAHFPFPGGE